MEKIHQAASDGNEIFAILLAIHQILTMVERVEVTAARLERTYDRRADRQQGGDR